MIHVVCEVTDGLRAAEATISVRDFTGRPEFFPADRSLISHSHGKNLLPVRLLYQDDNKKAAFIELPNEADSGASRMWVRLADIETPETVP